MKDLEYIPINIWDDFHEDGYVPEGEKQETYIYVENSNISHDDRKRYLEILMNYILSHLNTEGIKIWMEFYESRKKYPNLVGNPDAEKMFFDRWKIKLEGITHERLHEWLKFLYEANLKSDNLDFHIYSES
jgi:hypothetical protein